MNILVFGSGMYVTGRGGSGLGTLLSGIFQFAKSHRLETRLTIVSASPTSKSAVDQACQRLKSLLKVSPTHRFIPIDEVGNIDHFVRTNKFDAVFIATPDNLHYKYISLALESRVPVFVVKPVVETYAEHIEIKSKAKELDAITHVDFHKRFDFQNTYVRRLVRSGRLGACVSMTVDYSQRISIPRDTFRGWASTTNPLQYLGVHYIDQFEFITGWVPVRCMAVGRRGHLVELGVDTYDHVLGVVEWTDIDSGKNCVQSLNCSWIDNLNSTALSEQNAVLTCERGRIELDQKNRGILVTSDEGVESVNPYFGVYDEAALNSTDFKGYGYDSIESFLSRVKDGVTDLVLLNGDDDYLPTLENTATSTLVIECLNSSLSRQGTWVNCNG